MPTLVKTFLLAVFRTRPADLGFAFEVCDSQCVMPFLLSRVICALLFAKLDFENAHVTVLLT